MVRSKDDLDFKSFLTEQSAQAQLVPKIQQEEQIQQVNLLLELYIEALKVRASGLKIFNSPNQEELSCEFTFAGREGDNTKTINKQVGFRCNSFGAFINSRCYAWPDTNDPFYETGLTEKPRLLFAPHSPYHFLASVSTKVVAKKIESITLSNIEYDTTPSILRRSGLSTEHLQIVQQGVLAPKGIVLVNRSPVNREVDAAALVAALRPDSLSYKDGAVRHSVEEIISAAQSNLVTVSFNNNDPIEIVQCLIGFSDGKPQEVANQLIDLIRFVFVHRRVKRNCPACAKAAEVTVKHREIFPAELRLLLKDSYNYGSRCSLCSFSGFRGTIGVDCAMPVDEKVRLMLKTRQSPEAIAEYVVSLGCRPLLIDGFNKLFDGQTVFSELLEVSPKVSSYFLSTLRGPTKPTRQASALLDLTRQPAVRTKAESSTLDGRMLRLLIVEDDPAQLDILQLALQGAGFQVSGVKDAEEAFQVLERSTFDAIVSDYMLPGMNGLEFTKKIREHTRYFNIPVLILSILDDQDTEIQVLSGPVDDFVHKDVSRGVLIKRIERVIARASGEKREGSANQDLATGNQLLFEKP